MPPLAWNEAEQFKKSAKTRSWDIAAKAARKLKEALELEGIAVEPIKKPDHITVESAVDLYLSDMAQRGIKDQRPREGAADGCPSSGLRPHPRDHPAEGCQRPAAD